MGFLDLFRKKEKSVEVKSISLGGFEEEVNKFIKEGEKIEKEVMNSALRIRNDFYDGFVEKISVLKRVNLENRKEDLRLKNRVLEGKDSYVNYCEKLAEKIIKLEGSFFENYFRGIGGFISRFEKNSAKSYNVANILIGEEIAEVRKVIRDFFKLNEKLFFDNKNSFYKNKSFEVLLEKNSSFKNSVKLREGAEEELRVIDLEIKKKKNLLDKTKKGFLEFKQSEKYRELIEREKEREGERRFLLNQIELLGKQIDLKGLLGIHHKNDKNKNLLRNYRDNFVKTLVGDAQNDFLGIFDRDLTEKLMSLKKSLINLDKPIFPEIVEKKGSFEILIERVLDEISGLETKKENSNRLLERLKVREEEKLKDLRDNLRELDFNLKD